jgi:hypothetical protein
METEERIESLLMEISKKEKSDEKSHQSSLSLALLPSLEKKNRELSMENEVLLKEIKALEKVCSDSFLLSPSLFSSFFHTLFLFRERKISRTKWKRNTSALTNWSWKSRNLSGTKKFTKTPKRKISLFVLLSLRCKALCKREREKEREREEEETEGERIS